jgi:hypothetical protein
LQWGSVVVMVDGREMCRGTTRGEGYGNFESCKRYRKGHSSAYEAVMCSSKHPDSDARKASTLIEQEDAAMINERRAYK